VKIGSDAVGTADLVAAAVTGDKARWRSQSWPTPRSRGRKIASNAVDSGKIAS
jgi:hypothetical protein